MAGSHLIRFGTIKGKNGILEAMRHNKRTLQSERGAPAHIDATKAALNYSLLPLATPENIVTHAKVQMVKAGIDTPRKNAVMAIEIIFSLPINRHAQNTRPFFTECYEWVKQTFAGEMLAFDVHLDEAAPHAHAVILPLIGGKMQGNALIGNRGNLARLINLFHKQVAVHHGLSKSNRKRLSLMDKNNLAILVLNRLKGDSAMLSNVWACIREFIANDPLPFAQALTIELSPSVVNAKNTFVKIMTSKGKGSETIGGVLEI